MHSYHLGIMVRLLSVWKQQELVSWRASLAGYPQTQAPAVDAGWDRSSPSPLFFSRPSGDASSQIIPYTINISVHWIVLDLTHHGGLCFVFIRPFGDAALATPSSLCLLFVMASTIETALRG